MEKVNQSMIGGVGVTYAVTSSNIGRDDVLMGTEKRIVAKPSSPSAVLVAQGLLYGTLLCLGLLFNCCVIWLIRNKRPLHTVTNMWVTSLCIAQVLICAISLPLIILSVVADDWVLGSVFCRIFGFYTTCFRTVSILSVAGIALDRYHIVTRPFSVRMRKSSARILILWTWWSAVLASIPPLIGIGLYRYSPGSHMCAISWSLGGSALVFTAFYIASVYVTTLMATSFAYKLIYQVTKAQANKRRRSSVATGLGNNTTRRRARSERNIEFIGSPATDDDIQINTSTVRHTKQPSAARRRLTAVRNDKMSRRRSSLRHRLSTTFSGGYSHSSIDNRAALTIILVLATFVCTWIPYFAFALYSAVTSGNNRFTSAQSWTEFSTTWLTFSNVVWDPLLYGALNHNFRAHLKDWWRSRANSQIFKFSASKFRIPMSNDGDNQERSETVAANWREIVKEEEVAERENKTFESGVLCAEDLQEQMSESANTMTSCDCDVIISSPGRQSDSEEAVKGKTNLKVLSTSNDSTKEMIVHKFATRSPKSNSSLQRGVETKQFSSSKMSVTSQKFEPRDSLIAALEEQRTEFNTLRTSFCATSQNAVLNDCVLTPDRVSPSTTRFERESGNESVHSFRPLPVGKNEAKMISPGLGSYFLNKNPSDRRRYHSIGSNHSSKEYHINATKIRSASQTETSFSVENSHGVRSSSAKTFSNRDALASRQSTGSSGAKLSSDSGRLRRQKVRSQHGSDFDRIRTANRSKFRQLATAL